MKINERNLASFASSKTPVDRDGWLLKKGDVNKSFQKRWFVLKGNMLFYFERKVDKEPIGVVILEGCTIDLAENEELFAFKLVFHGAGNRTYVLCADSQDNMEGWMKALACASYDYMKLMVAELQRQLDEITELEKLAKSSIPGRVKSGIPVNRSDSCLWAHASSSSHVLRFNPFDRMSDEKESSAIMRKSDICTSVAGSNDALLFPTFIDSQDSTASAKNSRQRYSFIELHEYYGQIFRRVFAEQRQKAAAKSDINGENLINIDDLS